MSEENKSANGQIRKLLKSSKQKITIENLYLVFILLIVVFGQILATKSFISWKTQEYLMYFGSTISIVYLFYLYRRRFFGWIETTEGKVIYGIVVTISTFAAQIGADQTIRYFVQTNPDHFPSAQKALFIVLIIVLLILEIVLVMYVIFVKNFLFAVLRMMVNIILRVFEVKLFDISFKNYILSLVPYLLGLFLLLRSISLISSTFGIKDKNQNSINILEEVIIYSSFLPNKIDVGYVIDSYGKHVIVSKLFCKNINENDYISTVSPEQEIPNTVVDASLMSHVNGEISSRFVYKLSYCENSNDPDHVRVNDHH